MKTCARDDREDPICSHGVKRKAYFSNYHIGRIVYTTWAWVTNLHFVVFL
jgi:hypothetical protein